MKIKQIVILLAFLSFYNVAYSSNDSTKKWMLGFDYAPEYEYFSAVSEDKEYLNHLKEVYKKKNQQSKFTYKYGFSFGRYIYKNFWIETGIYYNDRGFRYAKSDRISPWGNYIISYVHPNTIASEVDFHIIFIGIPIILSYKYTINKNISVFPKIGLSAEFRKQHYQIGKEYQPDGSVYVDKYDYYNNHRYDIVFRNNIYCYNISVGVLYSLPYHFGISLAPYYTYTTSYTKDTKVEYHLYSYGLGFRLEKVF